MLITALGTGLAGQELRGNLVTMGLCRRMTHCKIMQGQGADLDTGLVGLPLRLARPDTPSPLAQRKGLVYPLRGSFQEPQKCGRLQDLEHPSSSRSGQAAQL